MRQYLSTLHRRPTHHKRRFALLTSSVITLFIFGVWSMVNFGTGSTGVMGSNNISSDSIAVANEVSPLQSLRMNLAASLEALKGSFAELKTGFGAVDLEAGYQEMRDKALDIYGQ